MMTKYYNIYPSNVAISLMIVDRALTLKDLMHMFSSNSRLLTLSLTLEIKLEIERACLLKAFQYILVQKLGDFSSKRFY